MITWKNLTRRGKLIFSTILFLAVVSYVAIPAGKLLWYLCTTTPPEQTDHSSITSSDPAFDFDNAGRFIVRKEQWFVGSGLQLPAKTAVYYTTADSTGVLVDPVRETQHVAVFDVKLETLPNNWKLVSQNGGN